MISRRYITAATQAKRFTLVELLVVVAIIAILAALLLPVLGTARYRAKLITCINRQHQLGVGLTMYANDMDQYYPYRKVNMETNAFNANFNLKNDIRDDRAVFRAHIPIDLLLTCPFSELEGSQSLDSSKASIVNTSVGMWFGGELVRNNKKTRMLRVGDRYRYAGREFDIIAADVERESTFVGGIRMYSSHGDPNLDYDFRDDNARCRVAWISYVATSADVSIDRNFLHDDGSVNRVSRYGGSYSTDIVRVPVQPGNSIAQAWEWLPPTD